MSNIEIVQGMVLDGIFIEADNDKEFEAMKRFASEIQEIDGHENQ